MDSPRSGLNWRRGLRGTAAGAVLGALAPVVGLGLVTFGPWLVWDTSAFDRGLDVAWLKDRLPPPIIACSLLCVCAGWATFAPRETNSFAWMLVVVAFGSFFVIATAWTIAPPPQRLKGQEPPPLATWRLILLLATPVGISIVLSRFHAGLHVCSPGNPFQEYPDGSS